MLLLSGQGKFDVSVYKSRKVKCIFAQIKEGFVFVIANQGGFNPFFCQTKESLMFLCTNQGKCNVCDCR